MRLPFPFLLSYHRKVFRLASKRLFPVQLMCFRPSASRKAFYCPQVRQDCFHPPSLLLSFIPPPLSSPFSIFCPLSRSH